MAQVLRYGIRNNFAVISFLIVSTAEFCDNIAEGLLKAAFNNKYRIFVHKCESISEVIATYKNLHVDFIVFGADSRLNNCLEEVEKNIFLVDQAFVLYGQTCLVHGNTIRANAMGVMRDKISEICNTYNLRLLNADVFVPEDCVYLGDGILNLAFAVLGHKSGFPSLNTTLEYKKMSSADDSVE